MALENVDPRIIGNIQQPNYLQGIGQVAQVSNALLGAQAQKQQIQANLATSDAFKQATDPTTGQTDWNQLRGLVAQGPAAYNLPQINQAITQNQVSQQDLAAKQFELNLKKQMATASRVGSLANLGPNVTQKDVVDAVVDLAQNGLLETPKAVDLLGTMPKDPKELQAWVKQHAYTSATNAERMQMMAPQVTAVGNGAGTTLINFNPMSAVPYGVIGNVQNGMSPQQLAQPITYIDKDTKEQKTMTTAQWLAMNGGGGVPGAPMGGVPGVPAAGGSGYTGRYGDQGQQASPGTVTGLAPGEAGALEHTKVGSADDARAFVQSQQNAPTLINMLDQAKQANKAIDTGKGSEWRNEAKSWLVSIAPEAAKEFAGANSVKAYDIFVKTMNNFASQQSANLGTGTDARLNIALTGNANPSVSKMANDEILAKSKAIIKMNAAKAQAWAQNMSSTRPGEWQDWSTTWNKTVNPDVFIFDELDDKQRKSMLGHMDDKAKSKFINDYNVAKHSGILQ